MIDNEIIKAMQCVIGNDVSCSECEYQKALPFPSCRRMCAKNALDLINRQKTENERLKAENKSIRYCYEQAKSYNDTLAESCEKNCKHFNMTTRAEAIKAFAERLKSKVNDLEFRTKAHRKTVPVKFCDDNANWVMHECVPKEIDKLVKEMTEVQE